MARPLVAEVWEILRVLSLPPKRRCSRYRARARKAGPRPRRADGTVFVLKTGIPGRTSRPRWTAAVAWPAVTAFARDLGGIKDSGSNPTERGRLGVKHFVESDARGIPLTGDITPANVPEVNHLVPLTASTETLNDAGWVRRYPEELYNRAYESEPHREVLGVRGIDPNLAKRNTPHGSGLAVFRCVVVRTVRHAALSIVVNVWHLYSLRPSTAGTRSPGSCPDALIHRPLHRFDTPLV